MFRDYATFSCNFIPNVDLGDAQTDVNKERIWKEIYQVWLEAFEKSRHSARGWIVSDKARSLIFKMLEDYTEKLHCAYQERLKAEIRDQLPPQFVKEFRLGLRRWYPGLTNYGVPLLSLHFDWDLTQALNCNQTFIFSPYQRLAEELTALLEKEFKVRGRSCVVPALVSPNTIAEVFDELRLAVKLTDQEPGYKFIAMPDTH